MRSAMKNQPRWRHLALDVTDFTCVHIIKKINSMCLSDQFSWTPNQLLTMINEIDQICPEEGLFTTQTINQELDTEENEIIPL
jgi:hypothetical protein